MAIGADPKGVTHAMVATSAKPVPFEPLIAGITYCLGFNELPSDSSMRMLNNPRIRENGLGLWTTRHSVDGIAASFFTGGAEGNRTPDLLNAIQALSQLSYGPDR